MNFILNEPDGMIRIPTEVFICLALGLVTSSLFLYFAHIYLRLVVGILLSVVYFVIFRVIFKVLDKVKTK